MIHRRNFETALMPTTQPSSNQLSHVTHKQPYMLHQRDYRPCHDILFCRKMFKNQTGHQKTAATSFSLWHPLVMKPQMRWQTKPHNSTIRGKAKYGRTATVMLQKDKRYPAEEHADKSKRCTVKTRYKPCSRTAWKTAMARFSITTGHDCLVKQPV